MANDFTSNFTRKLNEGVLDAVESKRVLSKNVNTQLLAGKFDPTTGENYDFKRPTDYTSNRTADGDISATTANSIIRGKATGTVQDYITVEVDFQEADQALKMGNDEQEFYDSMADRIVTDLEVDFAGFMMRNTSLLAGSVGTAADAWSDIAEGGAVMRATGVPSGDKFYMVNPYTEATLADNQRSLGAVDSMVNEAHKEATISNNYAGMRVMSGTTLQTYTAGVGADRIGAASANPDVTYVTAKDSMTQSIAVSGFSNNMVVSAGEQIVVTGRNRLNLSTRQPVVNAAGAVVVWSGTVTADVTLSGTGTGTLVVTGPGIYEATGAYNTTDSAIISGDVITLQGAASTLYQPNLFWHKNAFSIGSVPIEKLFSTDTIGTSSDGLQLRVSKGASIRGNKQIVRIDLRPAFATLNPFFAGQGFGK